MPYGIRFNLAAGIVISEILYKFVNIIQTAAEPEKLHGGFVDFVMRMNCFLHAQKFVPVLTQILTMFEYKQIGLARRETQSFPVK